MGKFTGGYVMATGQVIITAACRKIGIPSPSAGTSAIGLESMNNMLSSWSAEGLMIPCTTTEGLTLVVGKASYTILPTTGDFSTIRPIRIINAYIRDSSGEDHPVDVTMTKQEYDDISIKGADARPSRLYYDPQYTAGAGKIYFDTEPTVAETLYLVSEKPLLEIATLVTDVVLHDMYKEALVYNLAVRMADDIEKVVSPQIISTAITSKNTIENLNAVDKLMNVVKIDSAITYPMYRG